MSEHDVTQLSPDAVATRAVAFLPDEHRARALLREWMEVPRITAETSAVAMQLGLLGHPQLADELYAHAGTPSIVGQVPVIVGQGETPVILGSTSIGDLTGGGSSVGDGSSIGGSSIGADAVPDPSQLDPSQSWDVLDAHEEALTPAETDAEQLDQQPSDEANEQMEADGAELLEHQRDARRLPAPPFTEDGWRKGEPPADLPASVKIDTSTDPRSGDPVWRAADEWIAPAMPTGPSVLDEASKPAPSVFDQGPAQPDVSMGPPQGGSTAQYWADQYAQGTTDQPPPPSVAPAPGQPAAAQPFDPYAAQPSAPYPYPYPYPDPTTDPYAAAYVPIEPAPASPTTIVVPSKPPSDASNIDLAKALLEHGGSAALRIHVPPGPESYDGQWRIMILFLAPSPEEIAANGYVMETSYSAAGQPFQFPMWRLVTEAQAEQDTAEIAATGTLMAGSSIGAAAPAPSRGVALVMRRPASQPAKPTRALALTQLPRATLVAPTTKITRLPGQTIAHVRLPDGRSAAKIAVRPPPFKLVRPKPGAPLVAKIIPGKATPGHVPMTPYDRQWRLMNEWTPPSPADPRFRFVQRATSRGNVWRFIPLLASTRARIPQLRPQLARIAPALPRKMRVGDGSSIGGSSIGGSSIGGEGGCGAGGCSSMSIGDGSSIGEAGCGQSACAASIGDLTGGGSSVGGSSIGGSNVCGGAATGSSTCGSVFAEKPASMPAASGGPYLGGEYGSGGWPPTSARPRDSTDALADPLYQDPRVKVPSSLLSAPERVLHQDAIVGAYAIVGASCLSSDRQSSMEEFWRRREAIVGDAGDWFRALGRTIEHAFTPQPTRQRPAPTPPPPPEPPPAPTRTVVVAPKQPYTPKTRPSGPTRPKAPPKPVARPLPRPAPAPVVPPGYTCTGWQIANAPPAFLQGRHDLILQTRDATISPPGSPNIIRQHQRRWCYPSTAPAPTVDQQEQEIVDAVIFVAQLEQLFAELATLDEGARWAWFLDNPEILLAMIDLGWIDVPPPLSTTENAPGYDRGGWLALSGQTPAAAASSAPVWQQVTGPNGPAQLQGCGPWRRVDPSAALPAGMRWVFSNDRQWMCLASQNARVGQATAPRAGSRSSASSKPKDDHGVVCGPWLKPDVFMKQIGKLPPGYYWQRRYEGGQLVAARSCPKRTTVAGLSCCAGCAARDAGAILIGDVWSDIGHGVAKADQWLSTNVWDQVKDVVPYGQQIDQLHRARMDLLRQAAPEFYGPAASTTDDAILAAQALSRAVRRGEAAAKDRAVALKEAAGRGDPASRRAWFAYVRVASDDDRRIQSGT